MILYGAATWGVSGPGFLRSYLAVSAVALIGTPRRRPFWRRLIRPHLVDQGHLSRFLR
jgi:hypothetical protein